MTKDTAHIIVDLGFGDSGKGAMTDFLARKHKAKLVVRYGGGSQAAHNVVLDDGRHHTFRQIGSGAFVPGVKTLLSKFMLWDPLALGEEVAELSPKLGEHALNRHFVDERAPIITPFHVATNRLKEWNRGKTKHGSCGKGVGETASDLASCPPQDIVRAEDLNRASKLREKLSFIQLRKRAELEALGIDLGLAFASAPATIKRSAEIISSPTEVENIVRSYLEIRNEFNIVDEAKANAMMRDEILIFEGHQGVLLDEWHGFHPYTTWSTTTSANALSLLTECGFTGDLDIVGVIRAYGTRHGAGPFVTEGMVPKDISPGEHNKMDVWQDNFRVGGLDGVMLRYAAECMRGIGRTTSVAVTHMDTLNRGPIPYVSHYRLRGSGVPVWNLEPNFNQDLGMQEQITELLFDAEPVVEQKLEKPEDVVRVVEEDLETPVRYLSFGPQTGAKRIVSPIAVS